MNNSSRRSTRFFPLSFSAYFSPLFPSSSSIDRVRLSLSFPPFLPLSRFNQRKSLTRMPPFAISERRSPDEISRRSREFQFCSWTMIRSGRTIDMSVRRKKGIEIVTIKVIIGSWCMGISFENEITIIRCNSLFFSFSSSDLLFFFFFLDYSDSKVCVHHDLFYISYRFTFEQIRIKNTIWKSTINPKDQFTFTLPYDSTEINSTTKSSVTNERPPPNESRKQFSFDLHFLSASVAFPRNSQKLGKKSMTSLGRTNESKIVLEGKWS